MLKSSSEEVDTSLQSRLYDFDTHFHVLGHLGKGNYGDVYAIKSKSQAEKESVIGLTMSRRDPSMTGSEVSLEGDPDAGTELYAMKLFSYPLTTSRMDMIQREATITQGFNFPHVIQYYGIYTVIFNKIPYQAILMEYFPGIDLIKRFENIDGLYATSSLDLIEEVEPKVLLTMLETRGFSEES